MNSISEHIANALFDSGATHSFISSAFACKLNLTPETLGFQLVISEPIGVKMVASTKYENYEVLIRATKTFIDLIKFGDMEFDVILGRD